MNNSSSNKQKPLYFVLACVLLILTLGTSLYALGLLDLESKSAESESESDQRYRHISMSEAQTACEEHAREAFGERLFLLTMDKFSSRLDREEDLYKLFFQTELFASPARQGSPQLHYVNCFTGIHSPKVRNFEYSSDGQDYVTPGEEQKGLFGL